MQYPKFCCTALCALAVAGSAQAWNITINDLQSPNSSGWRANGVGRGEEDQETEPGTAAAQSWDLEAFTVNKGKLKVYTGYNMLTGNQPYGTGDIFIDTNGDAHWQPGADNHINGMSDNSVFKYDYVIHFTGRKGITVTGAYDVYSMANSSSVKFLETKFRAASNPWILDLEHSEGLKKVSSGVMTLTANTNWKIKADGTDLIGGTTRMPHYISSDFDLGFMKPGELSGKTLFHLTMECGNDSLVGRVPDAGSSLALMGAAMSGLAFFGRRNRRQS